MELPKSYNITQQEFDTIKSNSLLFISCENCSVKFSAVKKKLTSQLKHKNTYRTTCSVSCYNTLHKSNPKILTICKTCNKDIVKTQKEINNSKSGFVFCSTSCSASYNNKIFKLKPDNKAELNCAFCNKEFL